VFFIREFALLDLLDVLLYGSTHVYIQIGVFLHKLWCELLKHSEHVIHDENLTVAPDAGSDTYCGYCQ